MNPQVGAHESAAVPSDSGMVAAANMVDREIPRISGGISIGVVSTDEIMIAILGLDRATATPALVPRATAPSDELMARIRLLERP